MRIWIGNAFSLQMLESLPAYVNVEEVSADNVPSDAVSCIGHADTAAVVSSLLGREIAAARINVTLVKGDIIYVAQITGGRLPEGAKTLPDGATIKWLKVSI